MGKELCKFVGGTCNLCEARRSIVPCGDSDVCKRDPPVDMGVAKRFIEDHRRIFPAPTCNEYEENWRGALFTVAQLEVGGGNTWNGLSGAGDLVVRVYPDTILYPYRWFQGGCKPVNAMLIEKLPQARPALSAIGIQNGIAECYGSLFAIDTRGKSPVVMRPVQRAYRQDLLNRYDEFKGRLSQALNSQR